MECALCDPKDCYQGRDCTEVTRMVLKKYNDGDNKRIALISATLEAKFYTQLTRLEELIRFSKSMGYKKLGIAFCIGLSDEAKILQKILTKDFQVISVCCKVCGINKRDFSLPQIKEDRYEAMCNPLGQAEILNREKTELNIIFGLCMGHDILFSKYSQAPLTTLVVKDRVLAHNPLGAIYSGYYRKHKF